MSGPAASSSDVTVVTVAYSPGRHLDQFMRTIESAARPRPEVLIADNGSHDGAPQRAAALPGVQLIETGSNVGFGAAANLAISRCQTEFVLVANPDVEWRAESIDRLVAAARRWPGAAAVGPAIVSPDGDLYPSARLLPTIGTGIGHALLAPIWPANPWTRRYRAEAEAVGERSTGWISGSCMLMRTAAVRQVGGFDSGYFMYFEDVDLCARLHDAGYEVVYAPDAVIVHDQGHAATREPGRMLAEHHRSAYRFLARRYSGLRWLPVRLAVRAGLAARLALAKRSARVREGARPQRRASELAVLDQEERS